MDPSFLEGLQRYHDDWLFYKNSSFPVPAPILILNAGLSTNDFIQEVKDHKDVIIPPHVFEPGYNNIRENIPTIELN